MHWHEAYLSLVRSSGRVRACSQLMVAVASESSESIHGCYTGQAHFLLSASGYVKYETSDSPMTDQFREEIRGVGIRE